MKKTPIQQLIVKLEDLRDSIPDSDAMYRGGVINAIRLAEGMIECEREVITDAYWEGCSQWDSEDDAEDYYNKTFKNK